MKFYNPFKPHIVKLKNGRFAVRELSLSDIFTWMYSDRDGVLYLSPHNSYDDIVYARENLAKRMAHRIEEKKPFATFYSKD